jgi:DNA-binding MarR family transcriptional regulator
MTDDVDRLVADWHRERADLDLSAIEVFSRISRLGRHLDLARRNAFSAHGIEPWEFDVLAALRRAGKPYRLSPGRLIRETMVTSGTMTNRIDRLSERGMVRRLPDPADRRGVQVQLSAKGRRTVDAAFEALLATEHGLLDGFTGRDRAALSGLLRSLMAPFDGRAD